MKKFIYDILVEVVSDILSYKIIDNCETIILNLQYITIF